MRSEVPIHANFDLPEGLFARLRAVAEREGTTTSQVLRDEVTRAALWRDPAVEHAVLDLRGERPRGARVRTAARVPQAMADWITTLADHHRVPHVTVWTAVATVIVARNTDQPTAVTPGKPCGC
ncbi:hypothetical protein [Xylanimonas protaetiae]|uniref:Ribbon-helix-helix protein, CopG family n=1 Tax=Xylanimonas protaetiae TaxID=2509457 RepID=A0A4P6F3E0_9MICO|nr:hypothetical protein [Xylanimonas protaetiae]QAY70390.1 hypothetical protein ET471_10395 [Xylanimonas protaetiae]